jgi:hypothetical protein
MELAFAAPESGLPSLLTAMSSQHFLMELVRAAPESALPSLLTALLAHVSWAIADPTPNSEARIAAAMIRAISSSLGEFVCN